MLWFLPTLVVLAAMVPFLIVVKRAEQRARAARPLVVRVDDAPRRLR